MPQLPVISFGDSAAVVLPAEILESLGLRIGDVMEVIVDDRKLILRPIEDTARRERVAAITQDVFERRRDAYQRLA